MLETLAREASVYGIKLSLAQLTSFGRYQDLLAEWSHRVNLVGSADAETVERRHFLESIALGAALREREILRPDSRVLDIGAGAGFPGLVLKIVWPQIELTLLEATTKKTAFLSAVAEDAAFAGTTVLTGRAETLAHNETLRARFDLVVARAVAPLPVLLELALPFARIGGRVASPKGSRAAEEVASASNALDVLGGKLFSMPLPVAGPPQTVVVVLKQQATPDMYPRRAGVASKSPL